MGRDDDDVLLLLLPSLMILLLLPDVEAVVAVLIQGNVTNGRVTCFVLLSFSIGYRDWSLVCKGFAGRL